MHARLVLLLALVGGPGVRGQMQLLNESESGAEPVAGLIEGAPALARDGRLVAVEAGGRFRYEPGGTFARAEAEVIVTYQISRRIDQSRPHRPSRYHVTTWLTLKPRADATQLYAVRGWESDGGLRHVYFAPIALAQDQNTVITDRFEIDDDELDGFLRLHVFRGGQELAQAAAARGSLSPRQLFSLALAGDLARLQALDPAGVRQAARELKAAQVNALVRLGNHELLDFMTAAGMDLHDRDEAKRTALFAAAETGRVELVRRLLQARISIEAATGDGSTPLLVASQLGHTEVVRLLLAAGAKPDKADEYGDTPIVLATRNGLSDVVDQLLAAGAKWPKKPEARVQLLGRVIEGGHVELTERLLATGLDVNKDNHGVLPLVVAVYHSQPAVVARLLELGADPNFTNKGKMTPLMIATMNDRVDVMHQLIAAGADIHRPLDDGRTALVLAWEYDSRKAIEVLERAGASTAPIAAGGSTALTMAIARGDIAAARRLGELGAKLKRNQPAKDSILAAAVAAGLDQVVADALAGGWTLDETLLGGWTLAGMAQWYNQEGVLAALRRANGGREPPVKSVEARAAAKDDPLLPTQRIPPRYPARLRAEKAVGGATVVALVNPEGGIVLPKVSKADRPEFGEEAVKAAFGWRFAPSVAKPPVWRRVEMPFLFKNPELLNIRKFNVNQLDQRPVPVRQEPPAAPPGLAGRTDLALVEMLIDDLGGVYAVKVIAVTEPRWREPVIEAVKRWEFRPGIIADKSVWTKYQVFLTLPEGRSLTAGSMSAALEPVDPQTKMPRVKQFQRPRLPAELRKDTVTHIAYVTFDIDREGNAAKVRIQAASSPLLEKSILETAKDWWFEPAEKGGKILRTPVIAPIVLQPPGAPPF